MTTNARPMRRLTRGLVILTLACFATGCVNPNAIGVQDTGTVFGRVIDGKTQQPIVNAYVSINSTLAVKSGTGGSFTIPNVPIGTQTVTVYANGYQTSTVQVVVTKGQSADAGLISLTPAT